MAWHHVLMLLAKSVNDFGLIAGIDNHKLGPQLRSVVARVRDG
jgi:hypothetical protein